RSPIRLEKFKNLTSPGDGKPGPAPLLDVCTRWGSTYTMIERAIQCKNAYTSLMLDESLTMFFLEDVEWRRLAALRDLLGRFDQLTTKVCASKTYATITLTVVVYNSLMAAIENFIKENRQRLPDI
ncbi:hypothetical protein BGZ97_011112, partial [Linnemannia gamsii]